MIILSIDTSCDESCAAVFDTTRWQLLSDVVQSHVPAMSEYGGIVPELASREHLTALPQVVEQALNRAGLTPADIDHIAVTNRPGLVGALLVGLSFAKGLAWAENIPFSVQDHIEGHLYSPLLSTAESTNPSTKKPPAFPWIGLVVSGGHTELFHIQSPFDHRWLGGTMDDAAGEAFDKIGKILGLGYPAGPVIDAQAKQWRTQTSENISAFSNDKALPVAQVEAFHFSYSGLKTAVNLKVQSFRRKNASESIPSSIKMELSHLAQEAILAPLVREVRRALNQFAGSQAVITGGVACNSRLRELLPEAYFPLPKHCTDNAAMIALIAASKHRLGILEMAPWSATASARTDWPTYETATALGAKQ